MMRFIFFILVLFAATFAFGFDRPSTEKEVHFAGTNYELPVYKVYGRRDGNTMLIVGGIQGDEPGGYLSADLYGKLQLEQGNLIVIPRANLKSIILFNRGPDGDMNRLFTDNIRDEDMDRVVKVIAENMAKSSIFLNLHDGWGYHNPEYIDASRNPKRFGQSLIVDEETFTCSSGAVIDLKSMAERVLAAVNTKIPQEEHKLTLFNTKTGDPDTVFKEMRKTGTWYALRNYCIPAFGLEASKNLKNIDLKVLYHNYLINEFMKEMDIIPAVPPFFDLKPSLEYALITVNNTSIAAQDGDTIAIDRNAEISVKHIEANVPSGVTCDILGFGNYNDETKVLKVPYSTKIVFRKEDAKFAEINLQVRNTPAVVATRPQAGTALSATSTGKNGYKVLYELNNTAKQAVFGESVKVKQGDTLKLLIVERDGVTLDHIINLKGWVADGVTVNSGDDRNYPIIIDKNIMMKKYALDAKNTVFPIMVLDKDDKEIGQFRIEIAP
ncbi:MAG: hypothetical protein LBD73_07250 [Deferribacteraceae bacterium]|jgi:hypothetical protein|nr:hypothetical protein [Deferribacteraceae bacterium]